MPPFHIPLPRLYQTGFSLLLIATLVLLLVPFLTLIPQFPRPTSSRRFTVPLILFSATYFLILCVSVTIYTHRLWSTRKKLDSLPNARVDFTEIGGRSGDKVRERVKRNIARSAVVGYVGRPKDEDGGAEGKAGRDGAIREVWGLIGTGGGRWEDGGEEEMAELKIGYELIRWAGKEYEKDDALWEAVMRGVGRIMVREDGWDEDEDLENIDEEEDEEGYDEDDLEYSEEDNGEVRRIRTRETATTMDSDVMGGGMSLVTSEESRFQSLRRESLRREISTGSDGSYGSADSERASVYGRGLRRRIGSGDWDRDP